MKSTESRLEFTGAIFEEGKYYVSLCLDVDVASQGRTVHQAKKTLAEAVSLYLETCFESDSPYMRPVPFEEDPRTNPFDSLVEMFALKVGFRVHALA